MSKHLQQIFHRKIYQNFNLLLYSDMAWSRSSDIYIGQGRIQDFKLGGGALKTIAPSGWRREIFGVFRVKNHDFTPKNHIFSNFIGSAPFGVIYLHIFVFYFISPETVPFRCQFVLYMIYLSLCMQNLL